VAIVGTEARQSAWREQIAFLQNAVGAIADHSTASSRCAA